jgi:cytochrome P450
MVIQETMRLFPPIWGLIRIAANDDVIEGHQIRKGDKAVICTYVMHHSPKYWEEPEKFDPERFAPERWPMIAVDGDALVLRLPADAG